MDKQEYTEMLQASPSLWLDQVALFGVGSENLHQIKPGQDKQYEDICAALQLKKRPRLFIYDNQPKSPITKNASGFFSSFSGAIYISREMYEEFQQNKAGGSYVVRHEVGHASPVGRRSFIGAMVGLSTYMGVVGQTQKYVRDTQHKWQDRRGEPRTDDIPITSELASVVYGSIAGQVAMSPFVRAEELRADRLAMETMPPKEVLVGLAQLMEKQLIKQNKHRKLDKLREKFNELQVANPTAGEDEKALAWALFLSDEMKPLPIPMRALWGGYPSRAERMQQVREKMDRSR